MERATEEKKLVLAALRSIVKRQSPNLDASGLVAFAALLCCSLRPRQDLGIQSRISSQCLGGRDLSYWEEGTA